jgi:hypothetical protein
MSGKRPSLAESMKQIVMPQLEVPVAPIMSSTSVAKRPTGFYAATRAGKKKVTAALDPTMHKRLKSLALDRDTTTEALLIEAIVDLFRKYGKAT